MATLIEWNGLGLADGTTVNVGTAGTGDTPVSELGGANPVVDVDDTITPAIICNSTGGSSSARWIHGSAFGEARVRFYFKTPAVWPSASYSLMELRSGASTLSVRVSVTGTGDPGRVRLVNNATTTVATSPPNSLTVSTWYRAELIADIDSSSCQLLLYLGNNLTSIYDSGAVSSTYGSTADRLFVGTIIASPTVISTVAHIKMTDTIGTSIGPYGGSGSPTVKVWNGSSEVAATIAVWNGSSEVSSSVEIAP